MNTETIYTVATVPVVWLAFLHGCWQREQPQKPGVYPATDGDGLVVYQPVYQSAGECFSKTRHDWWWSVPFPEMPINPPRTT